MVLNKDLRKGIGEAHGLAKREFIDVRGNGVRKIAIIRISFN